MTYEYWRAAIWYASSGLETLSIWPLWLTFFVHPSLEPPDWTAILVAIAAIAWAVTNLYLDRPRAGQSPKTTNTIRRIGSVLVWAGYVGYFAPMGAWLNLRDRANEITDTRRFLPSVWKSAGTQSGPRIEMRYLMLGNLFKEEFLMGKSMVDILKLVGPPDRVVDRETYEYVLTNDDSAPLRQKSIANARLLVTMKSDRCVAIELRVGTILVRRAAVK